MSFIASAFVSRDTVLRRFSAKAKFICCSDFGFKGEWSADNEEKSCYAFFKNPLLIKIILMILSWMTENVLDAFCFRLFTSLDSEARGEKMEKWKQEKLLLWKLWEVFPFILRKPVKSCLHIGSESSKAG